MEFYVRDEKERARLIGEYLAEDDKYLVALDKLKADLIGQGVDIHSAEGRKIFIRAVRDLNDRFSSAS